jgi:RimJ/RimL family protein N-acetyltransferase
MDSIERQPHLITPELHLRPLRAEDRDALYAVAKDPAIWAQHPSPDRWQEPVFRAFFQQSLDSGGGLVVIDPAHGHIIGHSRYDLQRAGPGEMEIGWTFLDRRYWGGAMNAALKRAMIGHALRFVPRVIFLVGEHNLRSRRAMEKIGGVLTERVIVPVGGSKGRHVVYAIDREGFRTGPLMSARTEPAPTAQ